MNLQKIFPTNTYNSQPAKSFYLLYTKKLLLLHEESWDTELFLKLRQYCMLASRIELAI